MADDKKTKEGSGGRRSARGRRATKLDEDAKVAGGDETATPAAKSAPKKASASKGSAKKSADESKDEKAEKKPRRSRSKKSDDAKVEAAADTAGKDENAEKDEKKPRRSRSKKSNEVSEKDDDAPKAKRASKSKKSKKDDDKDEKDEKSEKKSKSKKSKKDDDEKDEKSEKKSKSKKSKKDDDEKDEKSEKKSKSRPSKKDEAAAKADSDAPTATRRGEVKDPIVAKGEGWLKELFEKMQLTLEASGSFDGDNYVFNISGTDTELMIGRSNQSPRVLTGMQTMLSEFLGREARGRVVVDIGGFKQKRQSHISHVGSRLGEAALKVGRPLLVAGLNAFDRRVIHKRIEDMDGIKSESTDQGIFRKLKIDPS